MVIVYIGWINVAKVCLQALKSPNLNGGSIKGKYICGCPPVITTAHNSEDYLPLTITVNILNIAWFPNPFRIMAKIV